MYGDGESIRLFHDERKPPPGKDYRAMVIYPKTFCGDCERLVPVRRDGSCYYCGSRAVHKIRNRCSACGGGMDEGAMVEGIHVLCIPAFIRAKGSEAVNEFLEERRHGTGPGEPLLAG